MNIKTVKSIKDVNKTNNVKNIKHITNIRSRRRAQMEVFGLAMIVIIIIIGFFLVVSFRAKRPPVSYQVDFVKDEASQKFLDALIATDVSPECDGLTEKNIGALAKSCATERRMNCSDEDPCTLLNETVYKILNETFMLWTPSFRLYSQGLESGGWGGKEIMFNPKNCTDLSPKGSAGTVTIHTRYSYRPIVLKMEVCTGR